MAHASSVGALLAAAVRLSLLVAQHTLATDQTQDEFAAVQKKPL